MALSILGLILAVSGSFMTVFGSPPLGFLSIVGGLLFSVAGAALPKNRSDDS